MNELFKISIKVTIFGKGEIQMNREDISSQFNEVAQAYDVQRKKLIPCFDDFYETAVSLASVNNVQPRILDLGAGTGLLSAFMLQKFPQAHVTLIDISEKMLEVAKTRLTHYKNIHFLLEDYTQFINTERYDIVCSALSVHHLSDLEKRMLYKNIYENLKPNGVFINADQVLGRTEYLDLLYKEDWKAKVEASDLSADEICAAYERTKLDKMTPLHTQLEWLKECGFVDVDCVYKYFNFAVMYARKV